MDGSGFVKGRPFGLSGGDIHTTRGMDATVGVRGRLMGFVQESIENPSQGAVVQDVSPPCDPCPVDCLQGAWWLVHTKSRCEKALATDLDRMRIGYFLPLTRMQRRYGGRTVDVHLPLFPSYLFLCGGEDERYATLCTHRAATVIVVADQERLKGELRQVHRAVSSKEPVDMFPGLRRGRRCRVIRGPLAGLEGVVLRRRGICRVYVGVEALGQSAELEIDPQLLEVIE